MPLATSLVAVNCHEGFHCVSAVDVFGRNHDFAYKGLPVGVNTPARFRGAYEWGCPARGTMTSAGDCHDFGKGAVDFCWSNDRYEAGAESPCKDPSMCMCIKDAENGTGSVTEAGAPLKNKSGQSTQGRDLLTKEYWVQPEANCEDCSQHNCNMASCNKCKNCEYATKTILGRTSKGCYFADSGVANNQRVHAEKGRSYLFDGMEGLESKQELQKLVVVPHYPLWDPGSARMPTELGGSPTHAANELKFPYQNRREPLSREAWIDGYKQAASRIQNLMDNHVANVKEWGPKANDIDCTQDIIGRTKKMTFLRRECKKYQALEQHIAPKTPFESKLPDGKGSFIPVNCVMGGQGMCQALNCYSDDLDLIKGITHLKERSKVCRAALGILVEEEAINGPIGEEAEITAKSGGRLEVALPPPGVEFKESEIPPQKTEGEVKNGAMPVEEGLALWTAAGVASTAWRNFITTTFSGRTSSPLTSRGRQDVGCPGRSPEFRRERRATGALHDFL